MTMRFINKSHQSSEDKCMDNEKIIITGKNSNLASTAGLLISILTAGRCFSRNLVFFPTRPTLG